MESQTATLYIYSPTTKLHERFEALIIGSDDSQGTSKPLLDLVYFDHLNTAAHHALSGIGWAETMHRVLDVPHQDDVKNQSFYYVEPQREVSAADLDKIATDLRAKDSTETSLLKEFLMREYKSETGDETPVH